MFISKLEIKNFKCFSDLTIDLRQNAELPKFVFLIGANDLGKSCIFDAFERYGFYRDIFYKTNNQKNCFELIDHNYLADEKLKLINKIYAKLYILKYDCFKSYLCLNKKVLAQISWFKAQIQEVLK